MVGAFMHDTKWIREHPQDFDRGLARRGLPSAAAEVMGLDERRRAVITRLEAAQARRNAASKEIAQAKAKNDGTRAQALMAEVAELKVAMASLEAEEKRAVAALKAVLARLPNLPLEDVPDGADAEHNVEHHRFGRARHFDFTPKQHFEQGEALGLMDFEIAAKLAGSRFVVLKGMLARLERALSQFMLDLHVTEHGYTEIAPPLLVRDEAMFGTAQLPKFADDQFMVTRRFDGDERLGLAPFLDRGGSVAPDPKSPQATAGARLWLIPTAEVPLTNLVHDAILEEARLPLRVTASTPCFRAEAGAAGKDTRGMIRQHQFTKVELVSVTTPQASKEEHARMLACAEEVLRRLDLHYRVMTLCAGDLGFAVQKTYDIEVWLPGQKAYREISSCSTCGAFQARRMNARYRSAHGRTLGHVHTLNGSGVAVGRALIAIMETYQQADGSIVVPAALERYMGGVKRIDRAT
jgi:seryl-tRNA synthetase